MTTRTDDLRIRTSRPLASPAEIMPESVLSENGFTVIAAARNTIERILRGEDRRLMVVVGPCAVHDPAAAFAYAEKLKKEATRLADDLFVVMRVYFEKPRTIIGWKGLINDPHLDGSFDKIGRAHV